MSTETIHVKIFVHNPFIELSINITLKKHEIIIRH